jgi:hypothetical protein
MTSLAYLHEHGLDAETLMGDQISVWPKEAITPALELWIIEHKAALIAELRRSQSGPLVPWRVFRGDTCIATMLSPCQTPEEALDSARQRWPGKAVTVQAWRCAS